MLSTNRIRATISLTMVIWLLIALMFLAVMSYIIYKNTGGFGEGTGCEAQGGSCVAAGQCADTKLFAKCPEGKVCCKE